MFACASATALPIAVADRELDRDVAGLVLAIDERGAGRQLDLGQFRQRHLDRRAIGRGRATVMRLTASMLSRCSVQAHHDREVPVGVRFVDVAGRGSADGGGDGLVDVVGRQAIAGRLFAIDVDAHGRLAQRLEDAKVGDPAHLLHLVLDLAGQLFQRFEVGAEQLDRVRALHARSRFLHVVLDDLREREVDAGVFLLELLRELLDQLLLVHARWPFVERLERDEVFDVEEAGGVGAVVRAAVGRKDGGDLRVLQHVAPDRLRGLFARFQRDRGRQRGADVHVAFFKVRQELDTERAHPDQRPPAAGRRRRS
jgi:hypothetical protein